MESFAKLSSLGLGTPIGSSDANFLVVPILNHVTRAPDNDRAQKVYRSLAEEKGVVVRFRGNETGCLGCLRITVGSEEENGVLLNMLEVVLKAV